MEGWLRAPASRSARGGPPERAASRTARPASYPGRLRSQRRTHRPVSERRAPGPRHGPASRAQLYRYPWRPRRRTIRRHELMVDEIGPTLRFATVAATGTPAPARSTTLT